MTDPTPSIPPVLSQGKWTRAELLASVPIDQSGPLPATTTTIEFLPPERVQQYARLMDGTFRLAWITSDDDENKSAHLERIAAGVLQVVPAGRTLADVQAAEAARAAADSATWAEVDRLESERAAALLAREKAKLEKKIAEAHARHEARTRGYRR